MFFISTSFLGACSNLCSDKFAVQAEVKSQKAKQKEPSSEEESSDSDESSDDDVKPSVKVILGNVLLNNFLCCHKNDFCYYQHCY